MSDTSKAGFPATASCTIAERSADEASTPTGLCAGTPSGMKITRSSARRSRTSSASTRCPTWMGLKEPPNSAVRATLLAHLAVAVDHELRRGQLPHAHRSSRVHARGGDAHLRAEPELVAVDQARGRVDQH